MMRKVTYELGRCARETGQALDRLGLRVLNDHSFKEKCTTALSPSPSLLSSHFVPELFEKNETAVPFF